MHSPLLAEAVKLSVSERIDLVAAIWDSLALEINAAPLDEAHRSELDRRLTDLEANPEARGKKFAQGLSATSELACYCPPPGGAEPA